MNLQRWRDLKPRERFFLFFDIIYCLFGLVLLILGALTLSNVAIMNKDYMKPLLDAVEVDSFQVGKTATSLSSLFLIFGVLILVAAGFGFGGTWCEKKYMLVVYDVLVLGLLLIKIIIIVLWFTMKNKVESENIKAKMLVILKSDFKDDTITNANSVSNAWNYMFMKLDCCAVNPVTGTMNDFDPTSWCTTSGSCQATSSQIPKTCCINVDENSYSTAPAKCHEYLNSGTYNKKGCYNALKDKLLYHHETIAGLAITIIVLEIPAVIFAYMISRELE